MAASALRTVIESAPPDGAQGWALADAVTQAIVNAIEAITISIDPGNVVIGTVTANAGTNLNTSALAKEAGGHLAAIDTNTTGVATEATLGDILAKIAADPSSETTLAAILSAVTGVATQTTLALIKAKTDNLDVALSTRLKPADTLAAVTAVTAITNALPAGTNNIGKVSPPASTLVSSSTLEASHVLKAGAGTLTYLSGYNAGPEQAVQLFNSATVPIDTSVPVKVIRVPAQAFFEIPLPLTGIPFTTGISVSNSSTYPTKTVASADCFFTAVVL